MKAKIFIIVLVILGSFQYIQAQAFGQDVKGSLPQRAKQYSNLMSASLSALHSPLFILE